MQYTLVAEHISKSFTLKTGQKLTALDDVSVRVRPGGLTALVGPDGAGKSTLLRILVGLLTSNTGSLLFNGHPFTKSNPELQKHIGYMPQRFGLYEDLTVQENLDLYADLKGVGLLEREKRYQELLAMSAMEPFRERLAGRLSGGMKQKLGLICTLISPPKLLLLDEPTVGVDPLSRRELWEIVERLTSQSGMSVVVSTSYLDEADRCDEVALLFEGKTLAYGSPESIRQHAQTVGKTKGIAQLAQPVSPQSSRSLQAALLNVPGIIDAVPQGGGVRFIHGPLTEAQNALLVSCLNGAQVSEVSGNLEDSFMVLLREHMRVCQSAGTTKDVKNGAEDTEPTNAKATEATEGEEKGLTEVIQQFLFSSLNDDTSLAVAGEGHSRNCIGSVTATSKSDMAKEEKIENSSRAGANGDGSRSETTGRSDTGKGDPIIQTKNVSRLFGDFIAVNDVSFSVYRGEVFGLFGPNGAGKTTTFRMLCGLLPASKGSLYVAGVDVRKAREAARRRLGYVAQRFSLYGPLSVGENLEFFAGAYGLRNTLKKRRIRAMVTEFSLEQYLNMPAENLPGGYKQRLAMAVGLLHEPAILFLDEPTSGADPLARRDFWKRISKLADQGVTIIVTTHFMEEAEYCDRILIQDRGVMLALGTPEEIRAQAAGISDSMPAIQSMPTKYIAPLQAMPPIITMGAMPTMEDAFIHIVAKARAADKEMSP